MYLAPECQIYEVSVISNKMLLSVIALLFLLKEYLDILGNMLVAELNEKRRSMPLSCLCSKYEALASSQLG